jgi:hypothetical protein
VTNVRLLAFAHFAIYSIPLTIIIVQIATGWAQFKEYAGDSCDLEYTNIYAEIFNTVIAFFLPIGLNIIVICASVRHVHLTSHLRQAKHHVSAREKYHRSLVIQFLIFYTIWLSLWSPNIIIYQFTSGINTIETIGKLLNFIEITLDPIIVGALDVRFYQSWKQLWRKLKNKNFRSFQVEQRPVGPTIINTILHTSRQKRTAPL